MNLVIAYVRGSSFSQKSKITINGDVYGSVTGIATNSPTSTPTPLTEFFKIEIASDRPSIKVNHRTADKMAISFSLNVPIRLKNLSEDQITVQNLQATLELPEGYTNSLYYKDLIRNSLDIGGRNHIGGTYIFSVQISGVTPERGTTYGNPVWEANRDKLVSNLRSGQIKIKFTGKCASLHEEIPFDREFDLTEEVLPKLLSF